MTTRQLRPTSDGLEILYRRYIHGCPNAEAALEAARLSSQIAQEIYDLRARTGTIQAQLADSVGTTHSLISRLEDTDDNGDSSRMPRRIAWAMQHRVENQLVPINTRRRASA